MPCSKPAARRAARGAENAVTLFDRALREPAPEHRRAETLLALGQAEVQMSGADATEHLRAAHGLLEAPSSAAPPPISWRAR